MKILFISRGALYQDKGGDTVQILKTAEYLRELGLEVDIRLTNEKIEYQLYDLIHYFNIIRPSDILSHIRKSKKTFVVSTIYVDYSEYEKKSRQGLLGQLFRFFSKDSIEYLKVLAKAVLKKEKIISPSYIFLGHRRSIKKILRKAQMLLPNSESEFNRFYNDYKTSVPFQVIPNGIDIKVFKRQIFSKEKDDLLIICVGRIEGRKSQLNLIKALNNTPFKLIIIGSAAPNQKEYFELCKKNAGPNIQFIDRLDQADLIHYYIKAKVHVLASWFETTGLSSLEAAAMGCNIVITDKGDTREYFKDDAYYCDPSSPESILEAVRKAASASVNFTLSERIFSDYTWQKAAEETLKAYQKIITLKK